MPVCTKHAVRCLAAAGLTIAFSGAALGAANYQITSLVAQNWSTSAIDVNNLGQVAVSSYDGYLSKAFIYKNGAYAELGGPAGSLGVDVLGLSDTGAAVGSYFTQWETGDDGVQYPSGRKGYVFDNGAYHTVAPANAVDTELRGISPDGRFVTGLFSTANSGSWAFVYDRTLGAYTTIPGKTPDTIRITVQGINQAGIVAGGDVHATGAPTASRNGFTYNLWTGERTDYAYTGDGNGEEFRDITSAGFIAGWTDDLGVPSMRHGIIGTGADQIVFDVPGATSTVISGINDAGWISGSYQVGDASYGFLAKPVPEASTVAMLLAGLGAMAWLRQSRRRRQ